MADWGKTKRGTPYAAAWTEEWAALVAAREEELDQPICGAVGLDGTPCPRGSEHASGRCTHHGGNHLVGGVLGNENARRHGLYARRLKGCDGRCSAWAECPFASADILELPAAQRPRCVYETLEYEAVVDSYLPAAGDGGAEADGYGLPQTGLGGTPGGGVHPHLVHTAALLQVMVSRAAAALSDGSLCETTQATGENYQMESTKVSAALEAFLRLAREHRAYSREVARVMSEQPEVKPVGIADQLAPIMKEGAGVMEKHMRKKYAELRAEKARKKKALEEEGRRRTEDPVTGREEKVETVGDVDMLGNPLHPGVARDG
jgi:hypothetical protein